MLAKNTRAMAREKLSGDDRGLRGYQGFFLALTLVVMIIIILTVDNLMTAVVMIGLVTNFLIISSQLTLLGDRHVATTSRAAHNPGASVMVTPPLGLFEGTAAFATADGFAAAEKRGPSREAFTMATTAPPGAAPPAFLSLPETRFPEKYPGAIDFGAEAPPFRLAADEAPALGHLDWAAADRDHVPVGNPYDLDRVASPQAAGPCVDDDATAFFDGDELNTYQARSRNNPERVWAGVFRRKALVGRFVREELDERENTRWWGAGEL